MPPSTVRTSAVIPLARSESSTRALPTSAPYGHVAAQGAWWALWESSLPKLPMPDAARVLIGPAEMALAGCLWAGQKGQIAGGGSRAVRGQSQAVL